MEEEIILQLLVRTIVPKEDNKLDEKLTTRCCWDGGLLSNTPLREVISKHKLFWEVQREVKPQKIKFTTWDESLWLY